MRIHCKIMSSERFWIIKSRKNCPETVHHMFLSVRIGLVRCLGAMGTLLRPAPVVPQNTTGKCKREYGAIMRAGSRELRRRSHGAKGCSLLVV